MEKILIIANARFKGGLSGSDAIYENFVKYWPAKFTIWEMRWLDFKPFALCYFIRTLLAVYKAILCFEKYDLVYSASDFPMDIGPAAILSLKGDKWLAGFFLLADKSNRIHCNAQEYALQMIDKLADMVCVTNETMYPLFKNKKKTWINGGIDLSLAGLSDEPKLYDAVFCGRIHPSKGIDELIKIWGIVRYYKPDASLAIIGDGDLGKEYIARKLLKEYGNYQGITLFGYMGDERYKIYKKSKVVLYPATWNHFSIAPLEAMACGCPMISFPLRSVLEMRDKGMIGGCISADNIRTFAAAVLYFCLLIDSKFNNIVEMIDKVAKYEEMSKAAFESAQQWDYKKQILRVWEDINNELQITRKLGLNAEHITAKVQ